jgi:hypothetical protein
VPPFDRFWLTFDDGERAGAVSQSWLAHTYCVCRVGGLFVPGSSSHESLFPFLLLAYVFLIGLSLDFVVYLSILTATRWF